MIPTPIQEHKNCQRKGNHSIGNQSGSRPSRLLTTAGSGSSCAQAGPGQPMTRKHTNGHFWPQLKEITHPCVSKGGRHHRVNRTRKGAVKQPHGRRELKPHQITTISTLSAPSCLLRPHPRIVRVRTCQSLAYYGACTRQVSNSRVFGRVVLCQGRAQFSSGKYPTGTRGPLNRSGKATERRANT